MEHPSGHGPPSRKRANEDNDLIEDFLNDDDVDPEVAAQDFLEEAVDLGEAGRNWIRPPVAELDPTKDSLGERLSMGYFGAGNETRVFV